MKQYIALISFVFIVGCQGSSQVKSEIENAFEAVDKALEKTQSEEHQKYFSKLEESDALEKVLIEQINSSENNIAIKASKEIMEGTYQISKKAQSLIKKLEALNDPRDRKNVSRIMIEEKQGFQLQALLTDNTNYLRGLEKELQLAESEALNKLQGMLETRENEPWVEFYFSRMPVIAVIPILQMIHNQATMTRIELLESVNQMKN